MVALSDKSHSQVTGLLKWGIVALLVVFVLAWVASILGLNLYNAIDNNTDYGIQTRADLDDRKGSRGYFIFIIIVGVLAMALGIAYAYYVFRFGTVARRSEDVEPLLGS